MEKQTVINEIAVLTGVLDALNRAEKKDATEEVVKKILELIEQL